MFSEHFVQHTITVGNSRRNSGRLYLLECEGIYSDIYQLHSGLVSSYLFLLVLCGCVLSYDKLTFLLGMNKEVKVNNISNNISVANGNIDELKPVVLSDILVVPEKYLQISLDNFSLFLFSSHSSNHFILYLAGLERLKHYFF